MRSIVAGFAPTLLLVSQRVLTERRVMCPLLVGVTALCAQFKIKLPFTEVPITGQTFAVLLTGMLMGGGWGGATQGLYVALGAMGLPIYAGAAGGWAALSGVTGGYLIGFVLAAWVVGKLTSLLPKNFFWLCLIGIVGSLLIYVVGVPWCVVVKGYGLVAALAGGLIPFLPGDGAKLILAASLATGYHKFIEKSKRQLGQ